MSTWSIQHPERTGASIAPSLCSHTPHGFQFSPPRPGQQSEIVCSACGQVIGSATNRDGALRIELREEEPKAKTRDWIYDELLMA